MVLRQVIGLFYILALSRWRVSASLLTDSKRQQNDHISLTNALQYLQSMDLLRQLINQETLARLSMSRTIKEMSHDIESLKTTLTDTGWNCSDIKQQFDSKLLNIKEYIKIHDKRISDQSLIIDGIVSDIEKLNTTTSVILPELKYDLTKLSVSLSDVKKNTLEINTKLSTAIKDIGTFQSDILETQNKQKTIIAELQGVKINMTNVKYVQPFDCHDIYESGMSTGVYDIFPYNKSCRGKACGKSALCDMDLSPGGWTVIQSRRRGEGVSFNRTWNEYKLGFGTPLREYWIGNDVIHLLTSSTKCKLHISIKLLNGSAYYIEYENFSISNESDGYRLSIGRKTKGTLDDRISATGSDNILNMRFHTFDRDNNSCSKAWLGGWWFNHCADVFLNGPFSKWKQPWVPFITKGDNIKETRMLINRQG